MSRNPGDFERFAQKIAYGLAGADLLIAAQFASYGSRIPLSALILLIGSMPVVTACGIIFHIRSERPSATSAETKLDLVDYFFCTAATSSLLSIGVILGSLLLPLGIAFGVGAAIAASLIFVVFRPKA